MFGYIPSPSTNGINLGPLRLHLYGFLIVGGVFAAVWLADRRWRARGGEPGTFSAIALWAVPAGLVGARLYHVITDYELYTHHPFDALKIWQGGLGIWGGIAGGVLAGWVYIRRHGLDFPAILDCVAPALPLAQAIGRWGNYFNQELFGRPTTLPWGLKIDAANRPLAYAHSATFQPTFLYESLWDLAVVGLVLLIEKRVRLRKGYLFAAYVALYTFGRFFTEYLRIDFAHTILGLRINDWVSVLIFVAATSLVLRKGLARREPDDSGVDDTDAEQPLVAAGARQTGATGSVSGETIDEGSIGHLPPSDVAATESEIDLPPPEPPAPSVPGVSAPAEERPSEPAGAAPRAEGGPAPAETEAAASPAGTVETQAAAITAAPVAAEMAATPVAAEAEPSTAPSKATEVPAPEPEPEPTANLASAAPPGAPAGAEPGPVGVPAAEVEPTAESEPVGEPAAASLPQATESESQPEPATAAAPEPGAATAGPGETEPTDEPESGAGHVPPKAAGSSESGPADDIKA